MSYAIRNSLIILGVLIATAIAGGYFVMYELRNEVNTLADIAEKKQNELTQYRTENMLFDELERRLTEVKKVWKKIPRRLYEQENSAISFAYFNRLSGGSRTGFEYNYTLSGTTYDDSLQISDYVLVGEARFRDLYSFVWKLENYPPLYRINNLEIRPVTSDDNDAAGSAHRVNFVLDISAFSIPQDGMEPHDAVPVKTMARADHNPFYPLVRENIPPNSEGLFDVRNAVLIGIAGETAFVRDRGGKTWTLKAGDRIYLGTLLKIDTKNNMVLFSINEGGIVKNIRLELFNENNKR